MWKCVTYPAKEEFYVATTHEVFDRVDSDPTVENFTINWEK